jgi:hypothetical protein
MDQDNDFDKAMMEVARRVVEDVQTGRAPLLSICDDGPFIEQQYRGAIGRGFSTVLGGAT